VGVVEKKANQDYHETFEGPVELLVRNPYQIHAPCEECRSAVASAARGSFDGVWPVNGREGVLQLGRPPRPRVIRLV
jgi:hypothetical protein